MVGKPRCPSCGELENVVGDGWPRRGGLLPIFKLGGLDWIYGKSYRHRGYPAKGQAGGDTSFNTLNVDFLKTLPPGVAAKFPGWRTRHQVVDKNLVYLLERHMVNGTAAGFARMVQEVELENVLDHQLLYAHHVDMFNDSLPKNSLTPKSVPKPFDGETLHGAARFASGAYYLECYKNVAKQDADFKRRHIMSQGGEVLRMDFTHREAKHIRIDGKKQLTLNRHAGGPETAVVDRRRPPHLVENLEPNNIPYLVPDKVAAATFATRPEPQRANNTVLVDVANKSKSLNRSVILKIKVVFFPTLFRARCQRSSHRATIVKAGRVVKEHDGTM
jgi:hypothetical protein